MFPGGISDPAGHETNDGDYSAGGHGPMNSTIGPDNVPCLGSMYSGPLGATGGYHVHSFLGIYYNGSEVALPDGLGFADPLGDQTFNTGNVSIPNWTNQASTCYYEMHTHDASGTIHQEAFPPSPTGAQFGSAFTLGDFLAVWGIAVSPTNWGPLNGPVTIYTSGQVARGGPKTDPEVGSNTYTLYCTLCDPNTVAGLRLYSHEVVWVLVGSGNPTGSSLPNVAFYDEW